MPYELKEKSSNRFLNTFQIAIVLSLGLHLLVYKYGFPVLLFKEKSSNQDDIVSTIELSPLEQARLPQLNSQWQIPQFNTTSLDEAAPPFALPLPPNSNLPPVPIPPGYRLPTIPNMSSDIRLPPLGITNISALPLPPPLEDIDDAIPSDIPLTIPEEVEEIPEETAKLPTPSTSKNPEQTKQNPEEKVAPEEIAAVREQKLTGNIRDISKSLQRKNVGTTNDDARKNYVAWLSRIEEVEPESIEIAGIYPKDACIRRLEGTSVYGVLVDAESQVAGLELIKGAEYSIFNEQASLNIQQHEFNNDTEEIKPYQVTVNYEYDAEICPSLTLPSLRKQEEAKPKTETPKKTPKTENVTEETPAETEVETLEETPTDAEAETPKETTEETPTETEVETPKETTEETPTDASEETQPSLRERLQNTPLPNNDDIRERLRQNTLQK